MKHNDINVNELFEIFLNHFKVNIDIQSQCLVKIPYIIDFNDDTVVSHTHGDMNFFDSNHT